jgi:hypothetical protein
MRWLVLLVLALQPACNESPSTQSAPTASAIDSAPAPTVSTAPPPPPAPALFEGVAEVACTATAEPQVLARAAGTPAQLAVDPGAVYVTSWDAAAGELHVTRVGKDAQGSRELAKKKTAEPGGIAVDARSVFYTSGGALFAVGRDGGEPKELAKPFGTVIAVDGVEVVGAGRDSGADRVVHMPKEAGSPTPLWAREGAGVAAIALDGGSVFFTTAEPGQVLTVLTSGGNTMQLAGELPKARRLALDETHLWFLTADGKLARMPRLGGPSEAWASNLAANAPLAVAAGKAFSAAVLEKAKGPVLVAIAQAEKPVAVGVKKPRAIAADASCVYAAVDEKGATVVYALRH